MEEHKFIWFEKYRPKSPSEFMGNDTLMNKLNTWIKDKEIPHLLFYGKPGTGKTTLAQILIENIECDYIYVNASEKTGVDFIRNEIIPFANSFGFNERKIIVLDESDYLSPNAQASLRNLMEKNSGKTRFILTCNYVDKIIDAIHSRVQSFKLFPPTKSKMAEKLHYVFKQENVVYEVKDFKNLVNKTYPDLRKAINIAQQYTFNNKFKFADDILYNEYFSVILRELKNVTSIKQTTENIRKIINKNEISFFNELFRYLYDNIQEYTSEKNVSEILIIIAEYQYMDAFVVDKEINIMAMFIKIIEKLI
jgi:replication factor C small subunit